MRLTFRSAFALLVLCGLTSALLAAPKSGMPHPDFTQGDPIPPGASHDWTLGATGARGWMYSSKLTTTDARQIRVTAVATGSPADGMLQVGDVILGVGDEPFTSDPRVEFGEALTTAETEAAGGRLVLRRWRDGTSESVTLTLPVLGSYSATAPYECSKSQRIFEAGCEALAERMSDAKYRENPIVRALNALALLASGEEQYLPLVKREAEWAAGFSAEGFQTWYYGYITTFLGEYVLATGDRGVLPGLRRLALESANGQSVVGSWGHRFTREDGRLGGYGMMNSPGVPLTIGLLLAQRAGVDDPVVDEAINKSRRLLRFYVGKGAIPYGDHHPWTQTHEDNGKCGMVAVLFDLLGDAEAAAFFSKMSLASHGSERDTGHTGNFFNILWAFPGVSRSGPQATGAWMEEFGARYFDMARRHDGSFRHQGPPEVRGDRYQSWDATGACLLAYALPLKSLHLTGKTPTEVPALDARASEEIVEDGIGWDNQDRNSYYDALSQEELLFRLGSWSPTVRERAAQALARKKADVVTELIALLDASNLHSRYGACEALARLGGRSTPAVDALTETLGADDLWLRVKAAEALASIGTPAMPALPTLLRMIATGPTETDPRGMEQRYLSFAVFGKLLRRPVEGVDPDLLRAAIAAGLQNEDGRARGTVGNVYRNLSFEQIEALLPAIHGAVAEPAPSGIMFASGVRLAGLDVLAEHKVAEGLPLCIDVMAIDKWGKQERIKRALRTLDAYGPAAKSELPRLRKLEADLKSHREAKSMQPQLTTLRKLIEKLEQIEGETDLRPLPGAAE